MIIPLSCNPKGQLCRECELSLSMFLFEILFRRSFKLALSMMNVFFLSVSYYLTPQAYYVYLGMLRSMWILNGNEALLLHYS
jgi:hypothetical protein